MQKVTSTTARPEVSITAARLSIVTSATALVLLAALHFLSPEFDPSWRMVSEYALGDYRWVLSIMFLAWAAGSVTLFFAIRLLIRTLGGKIGLGALLISALGAGMASIFDVSHSLHGLATIVGIPPFLIAAMLISASLLRDPAWAPARLPMLLTANLTWISFVLLLAAMFIGFSQTGGEAGPSVLIGWPNRLLIVACCGWLILTARRAIQIDRDNS